MATDSAVCEGVQDIPTTFHSTGAWQRLGSKERPHRITVEFGRPKYVGHDVGDLPATVLIALLASLALRSTQV